MSTPYVVGNWVYGKKFYGRTDLVETILHGNRDCLWLLGTRRIGKTSLLKQVEHLTSTTPELRYFPLFWDFQGAEESGDLLDLFNEALLDAADRLEQHGIPLEKVEASDLFVSLSRLRRKVQARNMRLLLLCDEVEELIHLNKKDPRLLRRLRRAMQSHEDIRSVLASKIKLWELSQEQTDTSPFLHGFTPPLYIHNLTDDESRSLICQANLPSDSRPRFDDDAVETIRDRCSNHPYLIQMLCERCLEIESLERAIEEIASDQMIAFFFAEDFRMLAETERQIVRIIGEQDSSTSNSIQERLSVDPTSFGGYVNRLEHLGYIRRSDDGRFILANYFFKRWFGDLPDAGRVPSASENAGTVRVSTTQTTITDKGGLGVIDDRYELLRRVGRGATGEVFKAHDRLLRVDIAVKLLKTEYAAHEEAIERLRREVILSRDLAHPNIVKMYHLGEHKDTKYITMQWKDGPTLARVIADEGPFADERTAFVAGKLASALETAHAHKVLHRDIKPHNILIDGDGEPHLTDFGLARLVGGVGMTSHGVFLGTPDYASPEQAQNHELDARSDLYALGVVMFEMATGRRPFSADSTRAVLEMHVKTPPPTPRDLRPGLSQELSTIILRCLEKDPDKRIQSAGELQEALQRVV